MLILYSVFHLMPLIKMQSLLVQEKHLATSSATTPIAEVLSLLAIRQDNLLLISKSTLLAVEATQPTLPLVFQPTLSPTILQMAMVDTVPIHA